jgi:hypothetical protein
MAPRQTNRRLLEGASKFQFGDEERYGGGVGEIGGGVEMAKPRQVRAKGRGWFRRDKSERVVACVVDREDEVR